MQPPVWGASGHCLREVNIEEEEEEEEEGEGSQKLFDAFDCFLNFSFRLNPCLVFILTSRRAEKDQWPQHLGIRPALKAFRSSPHTTWAPGDKTADCLCPFVEFLRPFCGQNCPVVFLLSLLMCVECENQDSTGHLAGNLFHKRTPNFNLHKDDHLLKQKKCPEESCR